MRRVVSQLCSSRSLRWGSFAVFIVLFASVAWFWNRGLRQKRIVDELVNHDIWVYTQYGPYQHEPLPFAVGHIQGGAEFRIYHVQRSYVRGFDINDEPPEYIAWLVPLLGVHTFARVTWIRVSTETLSEADIDRIVAFSDLRVLEITNTQLTDAGIRKLASLPHLTRLEIRYASLPEKSLRALAQCKSLKELVLWGADASDETGKYLQSQLPGCEVHW